MELLVVGMLRNSPQRFSTLRRMIDGISQRMPTRGELVSRTVTSTAPLSTECALTNKSAI